MRIKSVSAAILIITAFGWANANFNSATQSPPTAPPGTAAATTEAPTTEVPIAGCEQKQKSPLVYFDEDILNDVVDCQENETCTWIQLNSEINGLNITAYKQVCLFNETKEGDTFDDCSSFDMNADSCSVYVPEDDCEPVATFEVVDNSTYQIRKGDIRLFSGCPMSEFTAGISTCLAKFVNSSSDEECEERFESQVDCVVEVFSKCKKQSVFDFGIFEYSGNEMDEWFLKESLKSDVMHVFCNKGVRNPLGLLIREAFYYPLGFDIGICEDCTIDQIVGRTDAFINALDSEDEREFCWAKMQFTRGVKQALEMGCSDEEYDYENIVMKQFVEGVFQQIKESLDIMFDDHCENMTSPTMRPDDFNATATDGWEWKADTTTEMMDGTTTQGGWEWKEGTTTGLGGPNPPKPTNPPPWIPQTTGPPSGPRPSTPNPGNGEGPTNAPPDNNGPWTPDDRDSCEFGPIVDRAFRCQRLLQGGCSCRRSINQVFHCVAATFDNCAGDVEMSMDDITNMMAEELEEHFSGADEELQVKYFYKAIALISRGIIFAGNKDVSKFFDSVCNYESLDFGFVNLFDDNTIAELRTVCHQSALGRILGSVMRFYNGMATGLTSHQSLCMSYERLRDEIIHTLKGSCRGLNEECLSPYLTYTEMYIMAKLREVIHMFAGSQLSICERDDDGGVCNDKTSQWLEKYISWRTEYLPKWVAKFREWMEDNDRVPPPETQMDCLDFSALRCAGDDQMMWNDVEGTGCRVPKCPSGRYKRISSKLLRQWQDDGAKWEHYVLKWSQMWNDDDC